ncbi:oocyte zinc finger protein XlCOF6-like isoform X1 [Entelurus aequoreus]|uniref:oocyte zinc finger protein XlCOF6-like isoform X1 n=1 Tax=Entelurus aequoreus TaxID=161455 RepID=UPI002B1DB15B|nr:oocyte zinc finger protein XlCOF6-like isoform X1 [Entelurus aequoreus]
MATSSSIRQLQQKLAPPTTSKSSTETKLKTADKVCLCADVQHLIGHQGKLSPRLQGFATLKQENIHFVHVKEEEEELNITQEGDYLFRPEEADPTKLPMTFVSVKTENHEDLPRENLLAPLSHTDSKPFECSEKKTDVQELIDHQEEHSPQPQGISTLKQEDPYSLHIKEEEEEELWINQDECLLGSKKADPINWPLAVVSVKTEEHEGKPQDQQLISYQEEESPQPHEITTLKQENLHFLRVKKEEEGIWLIREADPTKLPLTVVSVKTEDHEEKLQANNLLAPLSDSEAEDLVEEPLSSDTDCEGDMRTNTDNKHSQCLKNNTGKKRFSCSVCDKSFTKRSYLPQHMKTHTGEKTCSCSICGKRFTHKGYLPEHMRTHTGEKRCSCSICGKRFTRKSSVATHMKVHTGEKPFNCSVCAKQFTQRPTMVRHMKTHTHKKSFRCSVCGELFTLKSSMVRHLRTHTVEKPFSCSVCGKSFFLESAKIRHLKTHTGQRHFSCSVCGKRFTLKSNMVKHMITHTGEKRFSCSVCCKMFYKKGDVVRHMRTHTGEKPFSCSVCCKTFAQKKSMLKHMSSHSGEKPFCCSVCGKSFFWEPALIRHMKSHAGEKPFSCLFCGKKFSLKSSMVRHMNTHSGEKPFSCSVCGNRFLEKRSMVRHMKIHTGEKPFSCSVCCKRFSEKRDMVRHMSTHTGV